MRTSSLLTWIGALALLPLSLLAQDDYLAKNAKMTIAGTSNLHPWQSTVERLTAKGEFLINNDVLQNVKSVSVDIDVKAIKSEHGAIMDGKTYDALKAKQAPRITYRLKQVQSIQPAGGEYVLNTIGDLTIAGVTKSVDMAVKAKVINGSLQLKGSKKLKMTAFGIEPPTALLGTLTTGDDITIAFELLMAPQSSAQAMLNK